MTATEDTTEVEVAESPEPPAAVHDQSAAIERITDAALDTPGVPGREEFLNLCMQARLLSMSAALPKGVRGNPHLCLHIVLLARDYGISPASAPKLLDFIPEDRDHPEAGGDLSLSPEFLCFRVEQLGLGKIELLRKATADYACAIALGPGGFIERDEVTGEPTRIVGEIGRSEFSWDDARVAGLVDDRCTDPMHHWKVGSGKSRNEKCDCRQGYRTYPKRMMAWRAKGFAAHDYFPSVSLGIYSAEELGADVDENGRPIDIDTVELPVGYDRPALAPAAAGGNGGPQPSTPEAKAKLKAAIATLGEEQKANLKAQWTNARLWSIDNDNFHEGHERTAWSLLRGVGWREETLEAPESGEAAQTGERPSESHPLPETSQGAAENPKDEGTPADSAEGGPAPTPTTSAGAEDNGYRDELDAHLAEHGIDGLIDVLRRLDVTDLEVALGERGCRPDEGDFATADEMRQTLGGIIVNRAKTARTAQTPPPARPAAERVADTPGQSGAPIRELPVDLHHRGSIDKTWKEKGGEQGVRDLVASWKGRRHQNLLAALAKYSFKGEYLLTTDTDEDLLDILVAIVRRNAITDQVAEAAAAAQPTLDPRMVEGGEPF